MTRIILATVRVPGAKMAPIRSTRAVSQTMGLKAGAKRETTGMIAAGRWHKAGPFLAVG